MSKETGSYTWSRKPIISKEQVQSIVKEASLPTKFRLLFRKSHYSVDGKSFIRFKRMNGITYVMKRGTHIEEDK